MRAVKAYVQRDKQTSKQTKEKRCAIAIKQRLVTWVPHMKKDSPFHKVKSLSRTRMRCSDSTGGQGFPPGMIVKIYPKHLLGFHVMGVWNDFFKSVPREFTHHHAKGLERSRHRKCKLTQETQSCSLSLHFTRITINQRVRKVTGGRNPHLALSPDFSSFL